MPTHYETVTTDERGCFDIEKEKFLDGKDRVVFVTLVSPKGLKVSGTFELDAPGKDTNSPITVNLESGEEVSLGKQDIRLGSNTIKARGCTEPKTPEKPLKFKCC